MSMHALCNANAGGAYGATLWRATPSGEVAAQADLQGHSSIVRSALWHPKQTRTVLTVEESGINKFTVDNERCELTGAWLQRAQRTQGIFGI